jgi:hypothetical protein
MPPASRLLLKRAKRAVLTVLAAGCAGAAGAASCVTAQPADLPQVPPLGPTIVQDAVMPAANGYLTALPAEFWVPVRVFDPSRPVTCNVFVDFDPATNNSTGTNATCPFTPPALDGGITQLSFFFLPGNFPDPTACHTIQCYVAYTFDRNSAHTPGDSFGADSVVWNYTPNGPGGCDHFAGSDGAFPPPDASMPDAQLFVPDAVTSPL